MWCEFTYIPNLFSSWSICVASISLLPWVWASSSSSSSIHWFLPTFPPLVFAFNLAWFCDASTINPTWVSWEPLSIYSHISFLTFCPCAQSDCPCLLFCFWFDYLYNIYCAIYWYLHRISGKDCCNELPDAALGSRLRRWSIRMFLAFV